jgi:6-pyruvoyltetrahydropterin/6-carboxytetrahydropterin synthase
VTWIVSDEVLICSSHQILEEDGSRETLHGHNWRVRVFVGADQLDHRGLVIDFRTLRAAVWEVVGPWDHRHLNDLPDYRGEEPTAESMARLTFEGLAESLEDGRVWVERVEVWMTETGCASYNGD